MSESCFTYPFPIFQRAMRVITSITRANPCVITTSVDHQYQNGLIVRVNITPAHGMFQINQQTGIVTKLTANTFSLNIDTTNYDPFVIPSLINYTCSQITPVGEITNFIDANGFTDTYTVQATQNVLPYPLQY